MTISFFPEPTLITHLSDTQKSKNDLLDKIYSFKKAHFTRKGSIRKNMRTRLLLNDIIVNAQEMGFILNKEKLVLYHSATEMEIRKKPKKVGKTPLRYDYNHTLSLKDLDEKTLDIYSQLLEVGCINYVEFANHIGYTNSLRPSEVSDALKSFEYDRKNRLTYTLTLGLYSIHENGKLTLKNGATGRFAEKHDITLVNLFTGNLTVEKSDPVFFQPEDDEFFQKPSPPSNEPVPF